MKTDFGITVEENMKQLPIAYWMPKMHKNPIGARFIIASKICATKTLSKHVAAAFKMFYD